RGERRRAVYDQVHTGPAFVRAAADPELEKIPHDGEPPAGELAGLRVSTGDIMRGCGGVGIDDALAVAAQIALVVRDIGALHGSRPECRAFDRPAGVRFLVPILESDVGPRGSGRHALLLHS